MSEQIDYDGLKKRGFLRQKQEGCFVLRVRSDCGVFGCEALEKLAEISRRYARGMVHATTRQGMEIPFIPLDSIPEIEEELRRAGIETGASGPRLRTTTCCPGNNWCRSGLVNTFSFCERMERELHIKCAMDLPHKFKIAVSGCPNACTRVQHSDLGIHGAAGKSGAHSFFGYAIYLGGCAGRSPRAGLKPDKVFTEEEALSLIGRVIGYYRDNAAPRQRLAHLIDEKGRERFLNDLGLYGVGIREE